MELHVIHLFPYFTHILSDAMSAIDIDYLIDLLRIIHMVIDGIACTGIQIQTHICQSLQFATMVLAT